MSEQEKSLWQIAYEAFSEEMQPFYTPSAKIVNERGWEAAAQAVAARVREDCARIAEDEDGHFTIYGQDSNTRVSQETAKAIANAIRTMNEASQ